MLTFLAMQAVQVDAGNLRAGCYDPSAEVDPCDAEWGTDAPARWVALLRLSLVFALLVGAAMLAVWSARAGFAWPALVVAMAPLLLSIPLVYLLVGLTPDDEFTRWAESLFPYDVTVPLWGVSSVAAVRAAPLSLVQVRIMRGFLGLIALGALIMGFVFLVMSLFASPRPYEPIEFFDGDTWRLMFPLVFGFGFACYASIVIPMADADRREMESSAPAPTSVERRRKVN
jgi:hypothetical protein